MTLETIDVVSSVFIYVAGLRPAPHKLLKKLDQNFARFLGGLQLKPAISPTRVPTKSIRLYDGCSR